MVGGISSKNAPSSSVVIPHYLMSSIYFLLTSLLMFFNISEFSGHFFNPKILAIVHIGALGWISMIIFGALYQLIPVIMDVKLWSENLAVLNGYFFAVSIALFSISFWYLGQVNLFSEMSGFLVLFSIIIFALNIFLSLYKSQSKSISSKFITTALIWFLATASIGLLLLFNLSSSFLSVNHIQILKLHAHFGVIGWFLMLIIGVGSRLLPMFLVSHGLNEDLLKSSYSLLNIGLVSLALVFFFNLSPYLILASALIVISGIVYFLSFLFSAYKKRIKRNLDIGMQQSMLAIVSIAFPLLISLVLPFNLDSQQMDQGFSLAYGFSIFIGFVGSLVLGQTYKTLPFIVWLDKYRGKIGKFEIPLPKDLYSERLAQIQYFSFALAFLGLMIGFITDVLIIKQISSGILVFTAIIYNINVFKIVLHKTQTNDGR